MSKTSDFIEDVSKKDVAALLKAEESYGDSWKKRGGVGAFMMLARKWDRIENKLQGHPAWDILQHALNDKRVEGIIDDVRDLRRYLLLVEAELVRLGAESAMTISRDNVETCEFCGLTVISRDRHGPDLCIPKP